MSAGHPDKICDIISDALVDECLKKDKNAHCAIEVLVTTNQVVISGEISSKVKYKCKGGKYPYKRNSGRIIPIMLSKDKIEEVVRSTIKEIGYEQKGFHWKEVKIHNFLQAQSIDIVHGVSEGGAGDQGIMVGYATDETYTFMPAAHFYAYEIIKTLERERKNYSSLLLDAKCQVTLEYKDSKPIRIDTVVFSCHHLLSANEKRIRIYLLSLVKKALPRELIDTKTNFYLNPAGNFIIGGPVADTGLTGRKIVVDSYGGYAPHGGGAFSGKDPTKVDRSGAYMARYLAKNVVSAGIARKCLVYLAYGIGKPNPVDFQCDFLGTGIKKEAKVEDFILKSFDLIPCEIINKLKLNQPIYKVTASGGHFGRIQDKGMFTWESEDFAEDLRENFNL